MVASAFTAPHATAFVTVDVTRSMKMLERIRGEREFRDVHVSPLLLVARAVCLAAARHPGINASWDELAQEIVVKHYVNLGIAVAAPRGLIVPSIKDAHTMSLKDLAHALGDLVQTARAGKSSPADLSGSSISVTNIGVFGVDSGTPILNPGEAAILCVGQVKKKPWVHKGKVRPRDVVDLSVSFDHRLVDGDLGSKFLADVARVLERPDTALRWA
jgi:pyruvate dehydrogenase E2 component (dihydrolipoamide acetyltransferase)